MNTKLPIPNASVEINKYQHITCQEQKCAIWTKHKQTEHNEEAAEPSRC